MLDHSCQKIQFSDIKTYILACLNRCYTCPETPNFFLPEVVVFQERFHWCATLIEQPSAMPITDLPPLTENPRLSSLLLRRCTTRSLLLGNLGARRSYSIWCFTGTRSLEITKRQKYMHIVSFMCFSMSIPSREHEISPLSSLFVMQLYLNVIPRKWLKDNKHNKRNS